MISASMVKELRNSTGAGMMDCKKALVEADGDMAKAIDILREKGLSQAAKKHPVLQQKVPLFLIYQKTVKLVLSRK